MTKRYLADVQGGQPPDTILKPEDVGYNKDGTRELDEIFEEGSVFSQPKATRLIQFLLGLLQDPNAIVLDSFAGSGTTGHDVLAQNKKDGEHRRFILIECEDYATVVKQCYSHDRSGIQQECEIGVVNAPLFLELA